MPESVFFGIVILSFALPAILIYLLAATRDWLKHWVQALAVAVVVIMVVSTVQYAWIQAHGSDILGVWVVWLMLLIVGFVLRQDFLDD